MTLEATERRYFEITEAEAEELLRRKLIFKSSLKRFDTFGNATPDLIAAALHEMRDPLYPAMRALILRLADDYSGDEREQLVVDANELKKRF